MLALHFSPCLGALFALLSLAFGLPSSAAIAACDAIAADGVVAHQGDSDYFDGKEHFFSSANSDYSPACVIVPESAEDVSKTVKALLKYPSVKFAVKSGGHNANKGYANVDGGVLIYMKNMNKRTVSEDRKTAEIGPGGTWEEVQRDLEPYGVAVLGGRLGGVGVGGLILGGGFSFLSSQYGYVCDTVVDYEIVLASGDIVHANAHSNQDLFYALKDAGGNQYGIVTKFTMEAFPIGKVWGGPRVYLVTDAIEAQILTAVQKFTENYHDPKASMLLTTQVLGLGLVKFFVAFYFYDGPSPPPGVFDDFLAIDYIPDILGILPLDQLGKILDLSQVTNLLQITDLVKSDSSYADLLQRNNLWNIAGFRWLLRTGAIPNFPGKIGSDLYINRFRQWREKISIEAVAHPDFIFNIGFQPTPLAIAKASIARNGSALHWDPAVGDRMLMEYQTFWLTALEDSEGERIIIQMDDDVQQYTRANYVGVEASGFFNPSREAVSDLEEKKFLPLFMNEAMKDQKVLESYGQDVYERMKRVQRMVDSDGFFSMRTQGFKFT